MFSKKRKGHKLSNHKRHSYLFLLVVRQHKKEIKERMTRLHFGKREKKKNNNAIDVVL